jgi:hypothetical protein
MSRIIGALWGLGSGFYMGWSVGSLYEHPEDDQVHRDSYPEHATHRKVYRLIAHTVAAAFPFVIASGGSMAAAITGDDPLEGMAVYGGSTVLGEGAGYWLHRTIRNRKRYLILEEEETLRSYAEQLTDTVIEGGDSGEAARQVDEYMSTLRKRGRGRAFLNEHQKEIEQKMYGAHVFHELNEHVKRVDEKEVYASAFPDPVQGPATVYVLDDETIYKGDRRWVSDGAAIMTTKELYWDGTVRDLITLIGDGKNAVIVSGGKGLTSVERAAFGFKKFDEKLEKRKPDIWKPSDN